MTFSTIPICLDTITSLANQVSSLTKSFSTHLHEHNHDQPVFSSTAAGVPDTLEYKALRNRFNDDMVLDDGFKAASEMNIWIAKSPHTEKMGRDDSPFHQRFGMMFYDFNDTVPGKLPQFSNAMAGWADGIFCVGYDPDIAKAYQDYS